jgi:hypothetical protein
VTRIAVLALLCLAVAASLTAGASANTNEQAFQKASACLVNHGATHVRVQHSIGHLMISGNYGEWTYGDAPGFNVTFFDLWKSAARATLITCVKQSTVPAGHLENVSEAG